MALAFAVLASALGALSCRNASDPAEAPAACEARLRADAQERGLFVDSVEVRTAAASSDAPVALLIAIHGLGDRPESFCEFMKAGIRVPARIVCPQAPNAHGDGFSWFPPMRTLTSAQRLAEALEDAGTRVELLTRRLTCDADLPAKPVLTGYSQGGMTSYFLARARGDMFSAVVPIAGMLPSTLRATISADDSARLYAFHGKADDLVPYEEARRTAEAFARQRPRTQFKDYAGVGHRLSPQMRADVFERLNELLREASP